MCCALHGALLLGFVSVNKCARYSATGEHTVNIYRVSREECARLWENVPYIKVH